MDKEIKERIAAINSGIIPEGYKKTKVGIVPVEWEIVKLVNIMHNEPRPVDKPNEPYIRIGIRSHAKGTFQELVENPAEVNMDTLYVVKKDDIVVNITFAWEHAIALASEEDDGKLVSHRFPTYVFDNNSPLYYKYVFCQDMFRQRLELISPGGAGRNRVLNKTDFINLEIYHPPLPEQQKIAEILSTQDKLIELQEKKIEQLKELKKAYLQKMFPKKGSKYPELRFKGFTDPWEQRKLITIADVLDGDRGKNYPAESDFTASGHTLFLNASNVTKDGFSFVDNQYISEEKSDSMGNGKLQEDDIVVTSRGSLGHIAWYNDDIMRFIRHARINSGMLILRKKMALDSSYLYQFMKSHKGQEQISFISFGSAQPQLTKAGVEKLNIDLPNDLEEQTQIGSFFSQFDTLITLHQRKSEQEKQKEKALMQLLLTGIVRTK